MGRLRRVTLHTAATCKFGATEQVGDYAIDCALGSIPRADHVRLVVSLAAKTDGFDESAAFLGSVDSSTPDPVASNDIAKAKVDVKALADLGVAFTDVSHTLARSRGGSP